jgi:hypothetical protein
MALEVQGGRLTLRAEAVPLASVLARLGATAGIVIESPDPFNEPISLELVDVSLEEGLRRLLQNWNTLFVYEGMRPEPSRVYILGRVGTPESEAVGGPDEVRTTEASGDDEDPDVDGARHVEAQAVTRVSELEEEFRTGPPPTWGRLWDLLDQPDPSVRITALHRLLQPNTAVDALTRALMDGDFIVQSAAREMLLERAVAEEEVAAVVAVAQAGDEASVRRMLLALTAW